MLTLALWPQRSSWRSTLPRHSAIQHPGEPQTENQGWREWQVSRRSVLYPVCCVTDQFLPRIIWFCNEYSLDQDNISRCMHVKKSIHRSWIVYLRQNPWQSFICSLRNWWIWAIQIEIVATLDIHWLWCQVLVRTQHCPSCQDDEQALPKNCHCWRWLLSYSKMLSCHWELSWRVFKYSSK